MQRLDIKTFKSIVFFTGAGMSAESGIPTYRGQGGIWHEYKIEEVACQEAFERDPLRVLQFHELRRQKVLECRPHAGHRVISDIEKELDNVVVVTQNIDGMHQFAGCKNVIELHGSLWRLRCPVHGVWEDKGEKYTSYHCPHCDRWARPDITWFGDLLDNQVIVQAEEMMVRADLLITIGTSAVVWPAAGLVQVALQNRVLSIEINPKATSVSHLYEQSIRGQAGQVLPELLSWK
ncbi:NAD-dependent deacylase [candidate division KSB1 bacterium]|nr:NAD-dependent deacylase [candidate division KSB1 bacterium]